MKAVYTITGQEVNVAPINDYFEIVEDSDLYIDLDDNIKTYSIHDLYFI